MFLCCVRYIIYVYCQFSCVLILELISIHLKWYEGLLMLRYILLYIIKLQFQEKQL